MPIRYVFRTAWNSLIASKLRAGLTALGVVIGVASVITTLALGNGAQAAVRASFRALGSNQIQINQKMTFGPSTATTAAYKPLTYEDGLGMLEAVPLISSVSMTVNTSASVRYGRNSEDGISVNGTTADVLSKLAITARIQPVNWAGGRDLTAQDFIGMGRFFSPAEVQTNSPVCVIGYQTALDLFEGDDPIGQSIWIGRRTYQVIGVLADLESTDPTNNSADLLNKQIFLPIGTAINDLFTTVPDVNMVATVKNENQIPQAKQEITSYLRQQHNIAPDSQGVYNDDFTLTTQNDIIGAQQAAANTFALLLAALAAIALTVGGIGIMNVMLISVSERTREIGVRLAVGARQRDIIAQFLLEAVIISAASGLVGILIGILTIPAAACWAPIISFCVVKVKSSL